MPATEPLSGLSYPVTADAASWAAYYKAIYHGLAGQGVPRFATSTARDTAYTNWVAAGYVLNDGALCYTQDADTVWIREGGSWRFFKYAGAVAGSNTPQVHIKRTAFAIPNGGTGAWVVNGQTIDRAHAFVSVNTTSGIITFNQRGLWSVWVKFASDYSNRGTSAPSYIISGTPYPVETTVPRSTGWPSAGTIRQTAYATHYLEAGATMSAGIYQTNDDGSSVSYDVHYVLTLIG